jgi:glycosyltransferase involved in cell wall biosynthesis
VYPVSAIIPCYNESAEAIAFTAHSALLAGADDIVLVDDGSATEPVAPPFVRHYTHDSNRGIAAALNTAAEHARYDHLAWLSVGDTWHRNKLEYQFDPEIDASFTDHVDAKAGAAVVADVNWRRRMWYDNVFSAGTTIVSRSVLGLIGGFDESLRYSVDWQFALAVEAIVGWEYVPKILATTGEFVGGHTDTADLKHKDRDHTQVATWAIAHRKSCMRQSMDYDYD